jgi:TRAP-type C4-dicarboxylate transport system permease small subunit
MLEKIGKQTDRIMEFLIAALFILMVCVGGLQVFNRFILNQSLSWSEELQKFSHIWLVFLTIPVAYNRGSHIGIQILFNKFSPRLQKLFSILFDLLWSALAIAIAYYSIIIMGVAKFQTSAGLGIRMDWVYFGMVIGGVYLFFSSIRKLTPQLRFSNTTGGGL